jgi:hypothetical protein
MPSLPSLFHSFKALLKQGMSATEAELQRLVAQVEGVLEAKIAAAIKPLQARIDAIEARQSKPTTKPPTAPPNGQQPSATA